jgi:hypothetical protein
MKIETYKCDVCGQICSQTRLVETHMGGCRKQIWIGIDVTDAKGNNFDLCSKHLLEALIKALGEDK